ncbi:UNVERIFIED_CONTAM: Translation factor GUF1, mitochondrial [Sesamum radiatum]|uniref:Translation factor GUF1, mitochondrial n=1 Tax=Sesamum radiatum TaxID=300843 RepID=A0AAW2RD34_SESRA
MSTEEYAVLVFYAHDLLLFGMILVVVGERERGITVKAQTATMFHQHNFLGTDTKFLLNLIDTPGHVDFNYEVSRSLAACQGVLLVVDAAQGVQAQTVANFYLAFEANLTIIPVINKIDQPTADPDRVKEQLKSIFDLDPNEALLTSAKTGQGLEQVLPAVIERIPPPPGIVAHLYACFCWILTMMNIKELSAMWQLLMGLCGRVKRFLLLQLANLMKF